MKSESNKSSISMFEWSCCSCGCVQWMPEDYNEQLRLSHKNFFCINGHTQGYIKKPDTEVVEGKLMNEYSKNAQLENTINQLNIKVKKLEQSFINRIIKPK